MNDLALDIDTPPPSPAAAHSAPPQNRRRWSSLSLTLIVLAWLILHIGGLFSPGLLDDVDSVYLEIAREMLTRHDFVTPYVDGIRFFDKPPLMYWLAAGSMHLFGVHVWAARLPLALLTLALFLATYALGLRLFAEISPASHPDRAALYAALALATGIGPYLYTRFFIPDILLALWMTLAIHLFLLALDLTSTNPPQTRVPDKSGAPHSLAAFRERVGSSGTVSGRPESLLPTLAFAAIVALNVLTKGVIGLLFPLAFVLVYLALTRRLGALKRLHPLAATATFLLIAAPWHILAALRNPPVPMPPGLGLPAHAGWAWFYLYNEHIARFFSRRIPHDYGQLPVPLFLALAALWLIPWTAFLPPAIAQHLRDLRAGTPGAPSFRGTLRNGGIFSRAFKPLTSDVSPRQHEAALTLLLWSALVLGFFTLSARQEYYSLPALPAFALMAGALLARADRNYHPGDSSPDSRLAAAGVRRWSALVLLPLGCLSAALAGFYALTAPHPTPGTDLSTLLAGNASAYNLSLGHLFDLTAPAMGLFRAPLASLALAMLGIGPVAFFLRRSRPFAANLTLAASATLRPPRHPRRPGPLLPHPRLKVPRLRHPRRTAPRREPRRPRPHRRRAHLRLHPALLHPAARPPRQRPHQRPLVRQLLARRPRDLRNRKLPPHPLVRPPPCLPPHPPPGSPHPRPHPPGARPYPRQRRRKTAHHPHQPLIS